ncbi:P-type ATPase [Xylariaceae sp. AK1471]|nr:P-type ATPase [Xylariaceae sp. AK1471]
MSSMGQTRGHGIETKSKGAFRAWRQRRRRQGRFLRTTVHDYATRLYQTYFLEAILRQKPLKPSKDGRHVPLRLDHPQLLTDERRGHPYISNTIRTSRYTVYNFVPKQLVFQFTRLSNAYFLAIGIPQTIPGLSTTGSFTTIVPLLFFVLLTILKEGYDDYKRHRLDKLENANTTTVLRSGTSEVVPSTRNWPRFSHKSSIITYDDEAGSDDKDADYDWVRVEWKDVKVGDIVRLRRDESVPADIVLLHATGENGLAYIDTMDLDGETNLKSKESLHDFKNCDTITGLRSTLAEFVVEDPNPDLYRFDGRVVVNGKTLPLTSNEVIYRGSTIRNTSCVIGIVINTGEECKIRMNANQHPDAKKPALEAMANKIVLTLVFYVIVLTAGCSAGYVMWRWLTERHSWYIANATVGLKQIIIGYAIQYNNIVPLSLYVTLELTRIGQMLLLNGDIEMYDEVTDTPARCNTNTILENLGQVNYVFSDKTGTLTDNIMKFRKMSIAGTSWLHEMDLEPEDYDVKSEQLVATHTITLTQTHEANSVIQEDIELFPLASPITTILSRSGRKSSQWKSTGRPNNVQPDVTTSDLLEYIRQRPASPFARRAKDYILCLALCHTCLPEIQNGRLEYQASSPDELALVQAARELGYLVTHRSSQSVTLRISSESGIDTIETYQILDVIEFSSKRKRMSIIVRYPDGRICLVCKGADSVIMPRLKLAQLAHEKATEVRKSADLEHEMVRRSEQLEVRNSFGGRPSFTLRRSFAANRDSLDPSQIAKRPVLERSRSVEPSRSRLSGDKGRPSLNIRTTSLDVVKTLSKTSPLTPLPPAQNKFSFLEEPSIMDEATIFSRCFKHLDEFATEGLRTLLVARKFIPEAEYIAWKEGYNKATTSLVNRQDMIEDAGEQIEQTLDLVGATAIEDKLQVGVPETIDKLRRANIKIWMLTGDKRETAINIAHSARICRPGSDIFILDSSKGGLEGQIRGVMEDLQSGTIHSVVVIDGQTLASVEKSPTLTELFYDLIPTVDSVICCRASPAQKSMIVKAIRQRLPGALTLAIGDGANDLAMISASHVGVGISGKEGLQAARVADYAIAQFRFLQRLLLVHGRWNYVRTGKFILATFWKEMFFYLPTAMYQMYNGYTGTSLYESYSLTVLNILFTSLCVLCMGIFEQDLNAETLLAVPELYVHGQRNRELNFPRFITWMTGAVIQGTLVWVLIWLGYNVFGRPRDNGLFAFGDLAFSIGILWTNWKLFIIETHNKTAIVMGSFGITVSGWWAWQAFLSGVYPRQPSPYAGRGAFVNTFGKDTLWWALLFGVLLVLIGLDITFKFVKRNLILYGLWSWPPWRRRDADDSPENCENWGRQLWQELEQDPSIREHLRQALLDEKQGGPSTVEDGNDEVDLEGRSI